MSCWMYQNDELKSSSLLVIIKFLKSVNKLFHCNFQWTTQKLPKIRDIVNNKLSIAVKVERSEKFYDCTRTTAQRHLILKSSLLFLNFKASSHVHELLQLQFSLFLLSQQH